MDKQTASALRRLTAIDTTQRVVRAALADLTAVHQWLTADGQAATAAAVRADQRLDLAVHTIGGCVRWPGSIPHAALAGADLALYLHTLRTVAQMSTFVRRAA